MGVEPLDGRVHAHEAELADAPFDEVLREVLHRVEGALDEQARLRLLLDAVVSMAADLTLDGVLSRIVEIASRLVDAQYAALGVLNEGPLGGLRTFVHHGMSPEQVAEIGALPTGHGLLGQLIDHPVTLRLHEIASHPQSYGFPDHHPPMNSFLGVPVRIRDRVFGNLYLTEKVGGGDFTALDESVVVALAAAAGVAIENARLYEEAAHREEWLAASAEITRLLGDDEGDGDVLQAVADLSRDVARADVAWIAAGAEVDELAIRVVSGAPVDADVLRGIEMADSLGSIVVRTGHPVSVEDIGNDPRAVDISRFFDWPRLGPATVVPLGSSSGVEGVLALAWTPEHADRFHALDTALPASFAEQAALALQVARARHDQQRLAVLQDRDRIGRDLHDLVIQQLFAVGLGLQGAARLSENPLVADRLERAVDDLDATIKDIRRSIFALGAIDVSTDVQTEVVRIVDRAEATLKSKPTLRFEGPVRTLVSDQVAPDVLAVLGEALSNASRHAAASRVDVVLSAVDGVVLTVTDDGRGLPADVAESGLGNMRNRARRHGGTFRVESPPEGGTRLTWAVPVNGSRPG